MSAPVPEEPDNTAEPTESDSPSQSLPPEDAEPSESFNPSATMEETVLVDESDVKITATGIKYAAYDVFGIREIGSVSYSFEIKDMDYDTLVVPPTITFSVPGSDVSYDASGEELYQEGGIRIVSKGLVLDPSEYSDDIHVLLLVENGTSQELTFDVDYDSVSVNGYMTRFTCYNRRAVPGGSAILDVELQERSLEENGITSLEDITEVELTVEIRNDGYQMVAQPVVTVNAGEQ